jgi:hypothetical protein
MSLKVAVKVSGESKPSYNSLRFATASEATAYAENLFSRWMLMTGFEIEESEDSVNYSWTDGNLVAVQEKA